MGLFSTMTGGDVLSGVGGLIQAGANVYSTIKTNQANKELAQYSYEQQRQMIQEQNEYNSPVKQMERYKEAGLNPNLMFGNISSGDQGQIAKYQAPIMQAPQVGGLPDILSLAMQLRNLKTDIKTKEIEQSNLLMDHALKSQEYFKRKRENVLFNALAGVSPTEIRLQGNLSEQELQDMMASPMFKQYEANAQAPLEQVALARANVAFQQLKVKEQDFLVNNLQPLTEKYMELRNRGVDFQNSLLQVRKDLNESLKGIGGERGAALIWLVLRSILTAIH